MDIKITGDNRRKVLAELEQKTQKALEECGMMAEKYASEKITKELNASPKSQWYTRTGALRNSIGHIVDTAKKIMYVGAGVHYAKYVEFGTGIYTEGGRRTSWVYKGSDGKMHFTSGMRPRPFIKPSITDHMDTYKEIIEKNLKK